MENPLLKYCMDKPGKSLKLNNLPQTLRTIDNVMKVCLADFRETRNQMNLRGAVILQRAKNHLEGKKQETNLGSSTDWALQHYRERLME